MKSLALAIVLAAGLLTWASEGTTLSIQGGAAEASPTATIERLGSQEVPPN